MKLQTTIAVNKTCDLKLQARVKEKNFRESLSLLQVFSKEDKQLPKTASNNEKTAIDPASFTKQIVELTNNLFKVQENMNKILQFQYDPEMLADLYFEIAEGYIASPDLRATWLDNLSSLNVTVRLLLVNGTFN